MTLKTCRGRYSGRFFDSLTRGCAAFTLAFKQSFVIPKGRNDVALLPACSLTATSYLLESTFLPDVQQLNPTFHQRLHKMCSSDWVKTPSRPLRTYVRVPARRQPPSEGSVAEKAQCASDNLCTNFAFTARQPMSRSAVPAVATLSGDEGEVPLITGLTSRSLPRALAARR